MRSILSTSKNVFCSNVSSALVCNAFEKFLLHKSIKSQTPLLFVRRIKPTIFIGCNQNPALDLDLNRMKQDNIELARLTTGGGATYVGDETLVVSFIKNQSSQESGYNEKALNYPLNNSIIAGCIKDFVGKTSVSQKHMDFYVEDDKVVHGTFKHSGMHRVSLKFSDPSWCGGGSQNPYIKRKQHNTMDIKSIGKYTPYSSNDFEAVIIKKFLQSYPPSFSSQLNYENIDIRKGAVHGMSNAWKQRSMHDNPDRLERDNGIKNVTEMDMLSIPEVQAMYDIKRSHAWLFQEYSHANEKAIFEEKSSVLCAHKKSTVFELEGQFDWGRLDLKLYCDEDGKIEHIDCYSDSQYKHIADILRPIFVNVVLTDKQQLMESFQSHLCHEIIEDTGAIFIINDVKNWLDEKDLIKFVKKSHPDSVWDARFDPRSQVLNYTDARFNPRSQVLN